MNFTSGQFSWIHLLALAKFYIENKQISAKILITSATLDLEKASRYLGSPNGLELLTKGFRVDIKHKPLKQNESITISNLWTSQRGY